MCACVSLSKCIIEGSLQTKVPTIWAHEKHSQEEAEPGRNSDVEEVTREKTRDRDGESQKREDAGARKGRKVAKHCGGSKSRLAKAAGAETSGQMRNENLHTFLARSTF